MEYDCTPDVLKHVNNVRTKLMVILDDLAYRLANHDRSKLSPPEKEVYDKFTPMLDTAEYGTVRYKSLIEQMNVGVKHHWSVNRHHPEYFPNSIDGMNLLDLVEMLVDWKAAGERKPNGMTIRESIEYNARERFPISDQMKRILLNTVDYLGW